MTSVPQLLTLEEASDYLTARGILTRKNTPYDPGTLKGLCRRGEFPGANVTWSEKLPTRKPAWHIPASDLDAFVPITKRQKPGYSAKEAGEMLGILDETVAMLASKGRIEGFKIGNEWRFTADAIEAYRVYRDREIERTRPKRQERINPGPEKTCRRCNQVKQISEYAPDDRYRDGYQSWCKFCHAEYRKSPEQKAKQKQEHLKRYSNPEYRDQVRAKNNARYRERWRSDPEFRKRKNDHKAMVNHSRRTKTLQGDLTPEQWKAICDHYGNRCLRCGKEETTLDHIKPISRGGEHTASNVQPLCKPCNSSKMTKEIDYRPDKGAWLKV